MSTMSRPPSPLDMDQVMATARALRALVQWGALTDGEKALVDYLATAGAMTEAVNGGRIEGLKYQSYERMLLAEGSLQAWQPRPKHVAKMRDKECFRNAFVIALDLGMAYVEGYAFHGVIPCMHAWCLDDGVIVDPTWDEDKEDRPRAYLGIVFDLMKVSKLIRSQETYGVLGSDWTHDFQLLRNGPGILQEESA